MPPDSMHSTSEAVRARPFEWVALSLRLALGLCLAGLYLYATQDDPIQEATALGCFLAFGAVYFYSPSWRALAGPMVTGALLHPWGLVPGAGAGLGMGLWLWATFSLCRGPVQAIADTVPHQTTR